MASQVGLIKKGFTLIEIMVSVSLFAVIMISMSSIFKLAIDGQRSAIITQNIQESLKYFLEVTAKEIRMAQTDGGKCETVPDNLIFSVSSNTLGDTLSFKNYYGECVTYSLESDGNASRFKISRLGTDGIPRSGYISPAKIQIKSLHFILNSADPITSQPMITINLTANALGDNNLESDMTLQTSITSRYYK
jgi:prepilin-type N-terminal cleavage/methylation domain-containing protein